MRLTRESFGLVEGVEGCSSFLPRPAFSQPVLLKTSEITVMVKIEFHFFQYLKLKQQIYSFFEHFKFFCSAHFLCSLTIFLSLWPSPQGIQICWTVYSVDWLLTFNFIQQCATTVSWLILKNEGFPIFDKFSWLILKNEGFPIFEKFWNELLCERDFLFFLLSITEQANPFISYQCTDLNLFWGTI